MNVGIIKEGVCINTALFGNMAAAQEFFSAGAFGGADGIAEVPDGYGIGDIYSGGIWERTLRPAAAPVESQPQDVEWLRSEAINHTKQWLTAELGRGMEYKGEIYAVTLEKQNLLSAQLGMYMMNVQIGRPTTLTWNASGKSCVEWQFEELLDLANAIDAYVRPIIKKQQNGEEQINGAVTHDEIRTILKDFM